MCTLPRGEIWEGELTQLFLATLQFGGDPLESTSRRPGIQVRQERMRVGESLQTCERRSALVVDEDEANLVGAVAVCD